MRRTPALMRLLFSSVGVGRLVGWRAARWVGAGLVALGLTSAEAGAQSAPEPYDTARHRLGPLAVNPQLAVVDVGVDTNVFNEILDPKSDFVTTVRPAADLWMRSGRLRLAAHTQAGANFFRRYSSERSIDTDNRLRLEARGNRLTPFATVSFLSARDRVNPEFNDRVRRSERAFGGGTDIHVGTRLTLRAALNRYGVRYSDAFKAGSYASALNRDETSLTTALRYRITPLTTLVLQTDRQANRFLFASDRDANTFTLTPGVEFDRVALISGAGFVGYRRFNFLDPRLKDFRGLVASIDLGYTLRGVTRLGFSADRNVEYSFEILQPYYVSSGLGVSVVQQATEQWSISGRVGRRRLDYRQALPLQPIDPRVDHVTLLGATLAYRLGLRSRVDVTANYQARSSLRRDREYDGLRVGSAFFYEF